MKPLAQSNLFVVDRIDCEEEDDRENYLEKLVPIIMKMKDYGFSLPTLMIRCAGKNHMAVLNCHSSMRAIRKLHENGCPLGLHIHTELNKNHVKIFKQYHNYAKMESLLEIGIENFYKAFGFKPEIFGMGDLACAPGPISKLLSSYGFRIDISDLNSNKIAICDDIKIYDYSVAEWKTDYPLNKNNIWWVPLCNDGIFSTNDNRNILALGSNQNEGDFMKMFKRYASIGERIRKKLLIIGSVVHPPEIVIRWKYWNLMHEIAREHGFIYITAIEALEKLNMSY